MATYKYSSWNFGQVEALLNILGGDEVGRNILAGKIRVKLEHTTPLLTPPRPLTLAVSPAKPTTQCFTDRSRYYYRDTDLDRWLPKNQPAGTEKQFSGRELARNATFAEMVADITGITGDVATMSKALIEGGHTVTCPQIEDATERQEKGEAVGLQTIGYANLFFVEGADGSVLVVRVNRYDGRQWFVNVHRLDDSCVWSAEGRVFARNS